MVCKHCHTFLSCDTANGNVNSGDTIQSHKFARVDAHIHSNNQPAWGSFTSGCARRELVVPLTSFSRTLARSVGAQLELPRPSTLALLRATLGLTNDAPSSGVGPNNLLAALMLDHSASGAVAARADAIAAQADVEEQKTTSVPVVSGL